MPPKKFHGRLFLLRWHRRVGVVAALFVLMLVGTGLLLNHSHDLGLDQKPLESTFWRKIYGLPPLAAASYRLGSHELAIRSGKLYLDESMLADCERLLGMVQSAGQVLVVCPKRLVLMTPDGQLIDQADGLRGVPPGLSAVRKQGDKVVLESAHDRYAVNLDDLSVHSLGGAAEPPPSVEAPPEPMPSAATPEVTRERLLQDIHSGRILGRFGPWLVDAMAVLFAVLAVSGLVLSRRRHHF